MAYPRARGHFQEPTASREAIRQLRDLTSPVTAFVREVVPRQAGSEIDKDLLWMAWTNWCEGEGIRAGTKEVLIRDLRAAYPAVRQSRPRDGGSRRNVIRGLQLKTPLTTPDRPGLRGRRCAPRYDALAPRRSSRDLIQGDGSLRDPGPPLVPWAPAGAPAGRPLAPAGRPF